MPRPNPTDVKSSFEVLPADTYEFVVGQNVSCKATSKTLEDGSEKISEAINYSLRVADGPLKDKSVPFRGWIHSEGGVKMLKPFLMAAMGFKNNKDGEAAYDAAHTDASGWDLDFETGQVGQYWSEVAGRRVRADVTIKIDGTFENNNFKWLVVE